MDTPFFRNCVMISPERNFLALFSSVFYSQDVQACAFGYKEDEMKFRRILIPAVVIVTMLVQLVPGTILGPRPVAAVTACDAAEFVADVTIPDGTSFAPGAAMVKTWRLKTRHLHVEHILCHRFYGWFQDGRSIIREPALQRCPGCHRGCDR